MTLDIGILGLTLIGIVIALLMAVWLLAHLFLHSRPTAIDSFEALTARLRAGRPTLLVFYSNF